MRWKMLIAEDEPGVLALLRDYFEMNGYQVITARDGPSAVEQASHAPDIILLDINMPGMDGLQVCRRIREHVASPIVFLTARVEDTDKIQGFLAGGDDYVTKPFSIEALGARVAAHLRREERKGQRAQVRFGRNLVIDYAARTVFHEDAEVPLARKEFDIVEHLSMHPGQVFDKERIYESVWGFDASGDSSVIPEHIKRIRAKLRQAGADDPIDTVWGVGYRWQK